MTIYKLVPTALWAEAIAAGAFRGSPVDLADGFIHFSNGDQVHETAAKHFHGVADLLVVAVESETLGEALKWEPSRGGDLFPHLYRSLAITEVAWVKPYPEGLRE